MMIMVIYLDTHNHQNHNKHNTGKNKHQPITSQPPDEETNKRTNNHSVTNRQSNTVPVTLIKRAPRENHLSHKDTNTHTTVLINMFSQSSPLSSFSSSSTICLLLLMVLLMSMSMTNTAEARNHGIRARQDTGSSRDGGDHSVHECVPCSLQGLQHNKTLCLPRNRLPDVLSSDWICQRDRPQKAKDDELWDCLMGGSNGEECRSYDEGECVWCAEPIFGLCVTANVANKIGNLPFFNCDSAELSWK